MVDTLFNKALSAVLANLLQITRSQAHEKSSDFMLTLATSLSIHRGAGA